MGKFIVGFLVLLFAIQLIPYGKDRLNPPVEAEPAWDSLQTRTLFMRACGDCHSHETKWPAYAKIAPISWVVTYHVQEGREHFNVSRWGVQEHNEADEAVKEIQEGEMPLRSYLLLHPQARLSEMEEDMLIKGLKKTFGTQNRYGEH